MSLASFLGDSYGILKRECCGEVEVTLCRDQNDPGRPWFSIRVPHRLPDHPLLTVYKAFRTYGDIGELLAFESAYELSADDAQRVRLCMAKLLVATCADAKKLLKGG